MCGEGTGESDHAYRFIGYLAWLMLTGSGFDSSSESQTGHPWAPVSLLLFPPNQENQLSEFETQRTESTLRRNHGLTGHGVNGGIDRGFRRGAEIPLVLRGDDSSESPLAIRTESNRQTRVRRRFRRFIIVFIIWVLVESALFGAHVVGLPLYGDLSG